MPNQAPEHLLPLCGSGRGTLPSPFGANRACGKSLEKSRQQVTNNLLVKSVGIKLLFQVSWHFLLLARLFIIRELILIFVSLTIRFDCGLHFAFIYLFRSSVCGICNLTINEKKWFKNALEFDIWHTDELKSYWTPTIRVFHLISGHFSGQIKFWSILIKKKLGMGQVKIPTKPEFFLHAPLKPLMHQITKLSTWTASPLVIFSNTGLQISDYLPCSAITAVLDNVGLYSTQ